MIETNGEKMILIKGMQPECEASEEVVRKEICDALRVENLNFLLGAGCSSLKEKDSSGVPREIGIPAMADLFEGFTKANPSFKIAHAQPNVIELCKKNLEKLLEILEASSHLKMYLKLDSKSEKKIATIKRYLREQITHGMQSVKLLAVYKNFYERVAQQMRRVVPINVFTTNYDLFNELALDELRFPYNNGFMGVSRRRFAPASFDYTFVENMNLKRDSWEPVSSYFNLIKLHGSISWIKTDGELVEIQDGIESADRQMMIYPSPLKDRSTLMTPYSDLFRVMENRLMRKNAVLIVIGYSFGDDHINRLIYNALASSSFRLIVLNSSDSVKKLAALKNPHVTVAYSTGEKKLHYFNNFVEHLLPAPHPDTEESRIVLRKFGELLEANKKEGL